MSVPLILVEKSGAEKEFVLVIHDLCTHLLLGYSALLPLSRQPRHWRVSDEGSAAPFARLPSACKVLKHGQKQIMRFCNVPR